MKPRGAARDAWLLAGLLGLLAAVALARPLLPIDETRYAAVAWEMWDRGSWLVPLRNGEAYHHKPPLLFWTMHAGWALFGVNEWWPRLISPLFAAATLALTAALGRRLWPARPAVARIAPFVLLSSLLYAYFATALMFDAMLGFFVALGLYGIVRAWQDGGARGFVWLALGLGGALYAKGPVALLHLMPAALFAPWWMRERRPRFGRWYAGVMLALLGGAALILAWAIPAGIVGGPEYRNAIFWGQTAGRMASSFAHRAPWWFYLAWLPLMLAPWLLWPRWWQGLRRELLADSGARLLLLMLGVALLGFSLISGKRWHYLLPEFAPFALLCARALDGSRPSRLAQRLPGLALLLAGAAVIIARPRIGAALGATGGGAALWAAAAVTIAAGLVLLWRRPADAAGEVRAVAAATLLSLAAFFGAADVLLREPYDVSRTAAQIASEQAAGREVAVVGGYHGQWHLAGRLHRPLPEIEADEIQSWLAAHPTGRVLLIQRRSDPPPSGLKRVYEQPRYRGGKLLIVGAD
ncbi:MAG TPA: glycosyltransferase family 39 protein [Rubrivivax sp.]|nr:glycosyltransferase family 39 protein [Rubrivivax sp.]